MAQRQNIFQKWKIDMVPRGGSRDVATRSDSLVVPPGFSTTVAHQQELSTKDEDRRLLVKRSWDIALGPLKQLPMSLFMMYMAGNSISIFPIMMVGMMIVRPVKALMSMQGVFGSSPEEGAMIGQKLVYIIGNILGVALALYKCQSMGLLPTHASDWLAFAEPQQRMEFAGGGLAFN